MKTGLLALTVAGVAISGVLALQSPASADTGSAGRVSAQAEKKTPKCLKLSSKPGNRGGRTKVYYNNKCGYRLHAKFIFKHGTDSLCLTIENKQHAYWQSSAFWAYKATFQKAILCKQ